MKKRHAMKWVNALRSGKYKQGQKGYLKRDGKYCCLGVLVELFPKLDLAGDSKAVLKNFSLIGLENCTAYVCSLEEKYQYQGVALTTLNDGHLKPVKGRFTFDEIADIIQLEYVERWAWV